jgi:hypothetical protein
MNTHRGVRETICRIVGEGFWTPCRPWCISLVIPLVTLSFVDGAFAEGKVGANGLRAALVTAEMATDARLAQLRHSGYSAAVLMIGRTDQRSATADRRAVERITKAALEPFYWIEIGRCPEFADHNPRWMASLQGHTEWRRLHKDFADPKDDEVVKTYPWTPVFYREAFDAHLARLNRLFADRPPVKGVFLNDLQGAPSACGCGNPVCRWTTDYGPIVTATRLENDAPAKFVAAVKRMVSEGTRVIPVWTTECEEHDKSVLCAGVGCYKGTCWKVYSRQLTPLVAEANMMGALLLYKEFGQNGPPYKDRAGWISHALKHGFVEQPAKHGGATVAASRLIAVLQGWNVSDAEIQAQIDQVRVAGAAGYIVALSRIDQSWQPRLVKWR